MVETSSPNNLEILGIIPARSGSKGVARKNIQLLLGKPLISYTFPEALGSKKLTRVILSTDDPRAIELAREFGIEVPFTRPSKLARDDTPMLEVVKHAVEFLSQKEDYHPHYVVILQPTNPLRKAKHIDEAITLLLKEGADSVVSVTEVPHKYNPHFILNLVEKRLKFFHSKGEGYTRRQELPALYSRNGAVYAFRIETLKEKGNFYGDICLPYFMSPEDSVNIDTKLDFILAEALLAHKKQK